MREMKWFLVITLVSLLFFWVTETPLAQTTNLPKSMVIVGGSIATNNFAFITGIAEMVTKYIGIKTIPTAGSLGKNVLTVHKKEAEFALTNDDRAYF